MTPFRSHVQYGPVVTHSGEQNSEKTSAVVNVLLSLVGGLTHGNAGIEIHRIFGSATALGLALVAVEVLFGTLVLRDARGPHPRVSAGHPRKRETVLWYV